VIQASVVAVPFYGEDPYTGDDEYDDLLVAAGFPSGATVNAFASTTVVQGGARALPLRHASICLEERTHDGSPCDNVLEEREPGFYVVQASDIGDQHYSALDEWQLWVDLFPGPDRRFHLFLPAPASLAELDGPIAWPIGQPLEVALQNQGFQSTVVQVNRPDGSLAWTNEATGIDELSELNEQDEPQPVVIPGEVLDADGTWWVGVAGMIVTRAEDLDHLDPRLSQVRVGQMVVRSLEVGAW
jgi:hypothetical protein